MFNIFNKKIITTPTKNSASGIFTGLWQLFTGKPKIDRELLNALEEELLKTDIGPRLTQAIIEKLAQASHLTVDLAKQLIRTELLNILDTQEKNFDLHSTASPTIVLVLGVNGSGKTTTIGKLALLMKQRGHKVLLAAGDTFRAAAIEQLQLWGKLNDIPVIAQRMGADSAAVIYDAVLAAQARHIDLVLADTAGRLHTHGNLMQELKKIKRSLQKLDPGAPHETLLVLDATIGQNSIKQAQEFNEVIGLTGLVLTKLDGTAKGGVLFPIAQTTNLPIYFLGTGEQATDLTVFRATNFIDTLLKEE